MNINNVGYKFTHGKNFIINRPKGSGDYAILFLRTKAFFTINGTYSETEAGAFVFYKKGTPQFFGARDGIFINDWLHLDLDECEEQEISDMGIVFDKPMQIGDISYFSEIIKSMHREKYSDNVMKEATLELYFKIIITKLSERLSSPPPQNDTPHRKKLFALRTRIYNEPGEEWTIDGMAEETALSPSYFQHLYKKLFGVSAIDDVISSRVKRAEYLLSSTEYSVAHIADECGYKNDVHFMRQFKANVGTTPSSYRNQSKISIEETDKMREKAPYRIPDNV